MNYLRHEVCGLQLPYLTGEEGVQTIWDFYLEDLG
jgi:hypothetical protein